LFTSEARIATDRATRYLAQLVRHASQMGRRPHYRPRAHGGDGSPTVEHAEWSDAQGTIEFAWGRCSMQATEDALTLHAEAATEDGLRRIQDGITRRLETIGRRDQLTVTWRPVLSGDDADSAPEWPEASTPRRRRHVMTIGLIAVGLLIVAVHVGLFGAGVADSQWTKWGVNIIVALVVVKGLLIVTHVALTRLAIRRRKRRAMASES